MKFSLPLLVFIFMACSFKTTKTSLDTAQNVISNKEISDKTYPLVETFISELMEKANLPGLSIAVSKNEKVIYAKGFGYADVANEIKMTPITRIRTASVAKVITATAVGRLVSEGKLDLDAPIKNYVPYIEPRYAELTTRQLAGHTSGMIHQRSGLSYRKKQYKMVKEMVGVIKNKPLLFDPDTNYKYSTLAFNLIAAVIEGASEQNYSTYLQTEIFKPLNMLHTMPENIRALSTQDARCYTYKKGKRSVVKNLSNGSYKLAGAGFRSTPSDLVKMMDAYINGLISPAIIAEMFKSHQLRNGEKTNVGIAWRPSYDTFGNTPIDHAGNWTGARTVIVHYPEQALNISIMINARCPFFIEETAHIVAQLFMGHPSTASTINLLNAPIEVTTNFGGETATHLGQLSLQKGKGRLTIKKDGFLRDSKIYYLGFGDHYAAVSALGLFYLNLNQTTNLEGNIYVYENRNAVNPIEEQAPVSFQVKN